MFSKLWIVIDLKISNKLEKIQKCIKSANIVEKKLLNCSFVELDLFKSTFNSKRSKGLKTLVSEIVITANILHHLCFI